MGPTGKVLVGKVGGLAIGLAQSGLSGRSPSDVARVGERFGRTVWRLARRRRDRAEANLAIAFPELSRQDRVLRARASFEHFGRVSADFLVSGGRTLEGIERSTEIVGREHLEEALGRGCGTLLVTGHFGYWERAAAWLSLSGVHLSVIVRDANDAGVNHVVNELRRSPGTRVISRGASTRSILSELRNNHMVGILSDQNSDDALVPFFGRMAGTNLGLGVIHARTGASVLPVSVPYLSEGRSRIVFHPLLSPVGSEGVKGEGMLRAYNLWLEGVIREDPEQWLWFHDRWRWARETGVR